MSEADAAAAQLPLFYRRLEALDAVKHRRVQVKARDNWAFARGSNAIPVSFSEIPRAAQEYPIVFAGQGERLHLVALVGLTEGDNLQVGRDGRWLGRYVPAYLRGYPFVLARAGDSGYALAFDPGADTVAEAGGAPLFDADGQRTEALDRIIEFLRQYEAQMDLARRFAQKVESLGLLVSVNADVRLKNGAQYQLVGLRVIERGALQRLSDTAKLELFDSDWLEMIHHQFASLQTLSALVDRLAERTAPATTAAAAATEAA